MDTPERSPSRIQYLLGTLGVMLSDPKQATLKKLPFKWKLPEENRIDLINEILKSYPKGRYLEIGCFRDACFSNIVAKKKVGVDPLSGGTLRMTSDDFFAQNNDKFDVVFIDGLHTYEQSRVDAMNALDCLAVGGAVLFHDMAPLHWRSSLPQRIHKRWNGDVWKTAVELSHSHGVMFRVVLADHGVGCAIKVDKNVRYANLLDSLKDATYRDYVSMRHTMPFTPFQEVFEMVKTSGVAALADPAYRFIDT